MTSYSEMTSSSSDDEDCKPVLIRKHSSTLPRHTPSKSDVGLTIPPVTSATSNSSSQITYDVTITTPWGDASTVTSQITCKRPVEFTHSWSFAGTDVVTRILTVVVENVTSSALTLSEPKLSLSNIKDITSLNGKKFRPLRALGSSTFAWKVSSSPFNSLNTSAQFHADLVSRCDDISDDVTSTVTYQFEVDNLRPIYTIACSVDDDEELRNGVMTSLRVDVTRLRDDPDHETTSNGQQLLMFQVMDTRGRWAVFGKSSGILSMPASRIRESTHDATHVATATVEVMPLVSGSLHMPYVLLHRFMKRRSSEFDEQLSSTQSPVLKPPRLRDFERGEVFYHHVAHQVAVLPPQSDVTHCVTEL
uniref:Trafficking protein particle complex subunit 10-like n=1 Tax=Phallusia mammillata TaxID=59560 RepID=A0A6F9DVQ9_9ASCI|nr:trafficking protein particle complex subunit 10-like [Phallusia mammillata]